MFTYNEFISRLETFWIQAHEVAISKEIKEIEKNPYFWNLSTSSNVLPWIVSLRFTYPCDSSQEYGSRKKNIYLYKETLFLGKWLKTTDVCESSKWSDFHFLPFQEAELKSWKFISLPVVFAFYAIALRPLRCRRRSQALFSTKSWYFSRWRGFHKPTTIVFYYYVLPGWGIIFRL